MINIIERLKLKEYDCKIYPPMEKKVNPETLKRVQEFLSNRSNTEWNDLDLLSCLESLYGQRKLFSYDGKKDHEEGAIVWKCSTYMGSHLITARAPTKIEAFRVTIITILKEFYYFPFNDHMELPAGKISENSLTGNLFQTKSLYPVFKTLVFDEKQKFIFKEKAFDSLSKFNACLNVDHCISAVKNIFETQRIQVFTRDDERMLKIHQFIWIGPDMDQLYLKAFKGALDIEIRYGEYCSSVANRIKESLGAPETNSKNIIQSNSDTKHVVLVSKLSPDTLDKNQNCCRRVFRVLFFCTPHIS